MDFRCRSLNIGSGIRGFGLVGLNDDRDFHGEARAGGQVVLDPNCAVVVGNDIVYDGEPQARAAAFGGEVRQEQPLLVLGGNAAASVGDDQVDGIAGACLRDDFEILHQRILHGLRGVIHEIHHYALELLAVNQDRRQTSREMLLHAHAVEPAIENRQGARNHLVQIAAR